MSRQNAKRQEQASVTRALSEQEPSRPQTKVEDDDNAYYVSGVRCTVRSDED